MAQRLKGQEVSLIITVAEAVQAELTDIQNFGMTLQTELVQQGYLGESTDRYDEVFKGAKFDFEMHTHSEDLLTFQQAIVDRARRKTPDVKFNIIATFFWPNGDTKNVTLEDVFFGPQAGNVPARADYVKVKIEGACSEPDLDQG